MATFSQIEPEDIARLNSLQLVQLLKILLHAEARVHCVKEHGIHVPFQITVADGGNDGEWDSDCAPCDYIPKNLTVYQCKAQDLSPTECKSELLNTDGTRLKSQVQKALDRDGAYVFFCNKGIVKQGIEDRIKKTREALSDLGDARAETAKIDILDANRIADWANLHSGAFAFVCRQARRIQTLAFCDFDYWKSYPQFAVQLQTSDTLRSLIADIRRSISEPGTISRITGPSGVGKTRMGFEVFNCVVAEADLAEDQLRETLSKSAFYVDIEEGGEEFIPVINQLAMMGYSGIAIVDNCPRHTHNALAKAVSHPSNRLTILTIDFEPEPPQINPLQVLLTPEIMREVVPKILSAVPGLKERIGEAGITKVAEFAQGFPQIAILTAEAGQALDLDALNREGTIADRLLWGRGQEDPVAKRTLCCLALFKSVGKGQKHQKQIEFLREQLCGGISEEEFNVRIHRFRKNRIVQEVGDFYVVTPAPLAAALAAEWLYDIPDGRLAELLPLISEADLTTSFAGRLSQLDFSPQAQALCEKLTGATGPFSSAEVLNSKVGSQVFRALSELNPLAALNCLDRVFRNWSPHQFSEFAIGRRNIIWALEKLVWDKELFPKAARLLRGFAAGESETYGNNATGQFRQLFHIFLSGTEQPLMDRLEVIEDGLKKERPEEIRRLTIEAIDAALHKDQFSRSSGAEQRGSQLPREDYRPETHQEVWEYWTKAILMLKELILSDDPLAPVALNTLGRRIGTIVCCPLIRKLEPDYEQIAIKVESLWPEARESLKHILDYTEGLTPKDRMVLEKWLEKVTPKDLRNRLIDTVATPGWHHQEIADGKYKDVSEENAVALANELCDQGIDWFKHVDVLLQDEQQQSWAFGRTCVERSENPKELILRTLEAYRHMDPASRNPQLIRGMLNAAGGTAIAAAILDSIANDPELRGDTLVPLTTAAAQGLQDFMRVSALVKSGDLPARCIESFGYGGLVHKFDGESFREVLRELGESRPEASPAVLMLVHAFGYRSGDRYEIMMPLIKDLVIAAEVLEQLSDNHFAYQWENLLDLVLMKPDEDFVEKLAKIVVCRISGQRVMFSFDAFPKKILLKFLRDHPKQTWPIIVDALRDEDGDPSISLIDTLARSGRYGENGAPIWELPEEDFEKWASENEDLIPYFVHYMQLYLVEKFENEPPSGAEDKPAESTAAIQVMLDDELHGPQKNERYVWHPFAKILLNLGKRMEILGCLHANLFSFGSTGSRVPYLEKRVELVEQLRENADAPELVEIAESLLESLRSEIATEKKRDEQYAAGIYAF